MNDLPNVDFPTISVTAELPGANPEVMASTVATPLERAVQSDPRRRDDELGEQHRDARGSRCSSRSSASIDAAAQDVQTAISQAIRRLPDDMDPPTLRKVNPGRRADHVPRGDVAQRCRCRSSTTSRIRTSRSGCRW